MAKTKISEWSTTPASNTDIDGINIAEGCAPSGINDAIRDLMAQVRSWQSGASGDPFNGPMNGTIGATTAYSGAFTTLSASGTTTLSGLTASTALALDASKNIVSVANTGSGSNVLATSPTLVTPALGTPSSATLTNATGLPISTGVSGLGTGVATALGVNVGSAGAPVVNGGALGTPSSGTVTNLTGTASININGTVGATTPTTGAFTTLAASSSVTLSGGTANGVTYLNGSKVLTSGSALTFDGRVFTVDAPSGNAVISAKAITNQAAFLSAVGNGNTQGTTSFDIIQDQTYAYVFNRANTPMLFGINNAEAMRLTSTGLGIGTSSPTNKLTVDGNANITGNTTLGDASTDTVTVNGYMGVGAAASADSKLLIVGPAASGTNQYGLQVRASGTSGATGSVRAVYGRADTEAASFTTSAAVSFWSADAIKGAGSTITNQHGVYINDQTQGTNNYGITSLVSSGTNKFNIYASGTAANYFAGNVGIGTSSPNTRLTIGGYSSANQTPDIQITRSSSGTIIQTGPNITFSDGTTNNTTTLQVTQGRFGVWNYGSGSWQERLSVDSAGNLGLGVTPSAWSLTNASALQIRNAGLMGYSNSAYLTANLFNSSGTWKYIATNAATLYSGNSGAHEFYVSTGTPSAGATATLTQAMTLDASGNLAVGATSASARLHITDTSSASATSLVRLVGQNSYQYNIQSLTSTDSTVGARLGFNVNSGSGEFSWSTSSGERARIDSSGNLLVGTTNTNPIGSNIPGFVVSSSGNISASRNGGASLDLNRYTSDGSIARFNRSSVQVGSIDVTTTATTYSTSSDYRLKNTIAPMTGALAKVAQLKPVTYKWNADGSDGEGFIAHELAEVCPHAVTGEKDAVDEEGNPKYQGIDTSFLVATLTAALQELNAKFDAYVASHP